MTDYETHKTEVRSLFLDLTNDKDNKILSDHQIWVIRSMSEHDINISTMGTILIQTAGRWCERYASDLFISWDQLRAKIKKHIETTDIITDDEEVFGFRKNGVDHDAYVYNRIINGENIDNYYSKLYMIKITDKETDDSKTTSITLMDIMTQASLISYHKRR